MGVGPYNPDEYDPDDSGEYVSDEWDEPEAVPCPACGEMISEEAPKCPYCGDWVIAQSEATRRSRTWFWPIIVVLILLTFILMVVR